MADCFANLPSEIVSSFKMTDANQRTGKLRELATQMLFDMLPIISWLERRRSSETAELFKRRMDMLLSEAVGCAGMEIPQYAGGKRARVEGEPAPGALRTASLVAATTVFAASLVDWAGDMETEDKFRRPTGPWEGDDWEALDPQVRRLLNFMHGRDEADLQDVCPVVWGKDYPDVNEAARDTTKSKANNFLRKRESARILSKVRGESRLRWK
jgi:hypothetical protein